MSLRIESLAFVLLMVILSSSVVSGQTQGMAIIANNPKAVGIGPFALGHVAFAYQNPSDGLFIFGSMEPTSTSPIAPSDTTSLNTKKEYTFDELKTFLANNGYTSYKAFYVDTPRVDAATAAENGLTTKTYNVAASVTPPINNENCLTAAIKVLGAYGASLPDTNLFTITPNAYYLTTPGKTYYPDFMGDDPVVPTSYQKPTEEAAVAGESGNRVGTVSNQPTPVILTLYFRDGSASGPVIQGAQVVGQDASGNSFQETADSRGYVTIAGDPGTWSFTASADGYKSNSWAQGITETDTKDAFLQKEKSSTEGSAEPQQQEPIASATPVTLTLYVHDGDQNGPAIIDAEVTGQDGSGNSFQQTTDRSGSVIISGNPGTWSFSASAFGYQTKSWSQQISDTCDSYEYLQQVQQQESVPTTTPQGSESSVVGKWTFHVESNCPAKDGSPATWDSVIDINNDDTFTASNYDNGAGNWVQSGDTIRLQQNPRPGQDSGSLKIWQSEGDTYEGTINGDTMSGTGLSVTHLSLGGQNEGDTSCSNHWSASRVGTGDSGSQGGTIPNQPPVNSGLITNQYEADGLSPGSSYSPRDAAWAAKGTGKMGRG